MIQQSYGPLRKYAMDYVIGNLKLDSNSSKCTIKCPTVCKESKSCIVSVLMVRKV